MQRINFDFDIEWTEDIWSYHNVDVEIDFDRNGDLQTCDVWFDGRMSPVKEGYKLLKAMGAEDLDWLIQTAKEAEGWVA